MSRVINELTSDSSVVCSFYSFIFSIVNTRANCHFRGAKIARKIYARAFIFPPFFKESHLKAMKIHPIVFIFFSTPVYLFLVVLLVMAAVKVCVFSPRSRNSNETCSFELRAVCELEAMACGFSHPVFVCFKHLQEKKRTASQKCCYPLKEEGSCNGAILSCPKRFFEVFISFKSSPVGTHICAGHVAEADFTLAITSHPMYVGPRTRKVSQN